MKEMPTPPEGHKLVWGRDMVGPLHPEGLFWYNSPAPLFGKSEWCKSSMAGEEVGHRNRNILYAIPIEL